MREEVGKVEILSKNYSYTSNSQPIIPFSGREKGSKPSAEFIKRVSLSRAMLLGLVHFYTFESLKCPGCDE